MLAPELLKFEVPTFWSSLIRVMAINYKHNWMIESFIESMTVDHVGYVCENMIRC